MREIKFSLFSRESRENGNPKIASNSRLVRKKPRALKKIRSLACSETELLHEELHHHLGTHHLDFGLHVDVSKKSFQDHSKASICSLCAKLHHPNPKNKKVMKIYSQISIKSIPLSKLPVNAVIADVCSS